MADIIHALILGIVQGLTEFLPISSSAHLNVFPWIFGWDEISESFDLALHLGTLVAICIFFFKDWVNLIKGGFRKVFKKEDSLDGKIFWYLVIATIPAGILSLVLDKISSYIVGDNLNLVDKKCDSKVSYENITLKQSILIGVSQALAAAFPGVSRSGITMTVGRSLKIDRESAAKFSFLLATPIVLAALLVDLPAFSFSIPFLVGVIASFLVGLFVIKFLMDYLKKGSFKVFAVYRIILGIIILGIVFLR